MTTPPRIIAIFILLFGIMLSAPSASAQVSGPDKPTAGATPGGVNSGSASDAELWRQIRRGDSGTVVGGDKSGGMMIQSGGQDWRLMRNGPLPKYTAWAILGMLLLLSLFFAVRGRIRVAGGFSGTKIQRFTLIERVGHWLLASSFILLALTGLNLVFGRALLIPLLGKDVFASVTVFGKFIHNYVAFAFILGLIMIVVMWVWHNIPNWHDVKWLLRAGGAIGSGHPPAKKFNAGQKIIFWIVVLCGISISMSGWALMNPFTTNMFSGTFAIANDWLGTSYATDLSPIQEQQYQSLWHTIMAVFMIVVILAHIYIGTIGMEGALPAMTTGRVDTNWAREHHALWVEDEEAKHWGKPTRMAAVRTGDASLSSPSSRLAAAAGVTRPRAVLPRVDSASDSYAVKRRAPLANVVVEEPVVVEKTPHREAQDVKPAPKVKRKTRAATKTVAKKKAAGKPKVSAKKKTATKAKAPATRKAATGRTAPGKTVKAKIVTKKTAAKPAAKTPAKPKAAKSRARDDLKLIKGVGPQNEKKLNAIGVRRFEDVAKWTKKQQSDIGDRLAFPGRIEREDWVKQAKALARSAKKA